MRCNAYNGKHYILFGDKISCLKIAKKLALIGIVFEEAYTPEGFCCSIEGLKFISEYEVKNKMVKSEIFIRVADGWENESYEFAVKTGISARRFVKDSDVRSLAFRKANIDINLGYDYDINYIGSRCLSYDKNGNQKLKIAVLGDSTSDVCLSVEKTWVEYLGEMLGEKYDFELYCAAVEGYVGSQQLVKFVRDILPWQPDIVINSIRVSDFYNSSQEDAFSNRYQTYLAKQYAFATEKSISIPPQGICANTQERVIMLQRCIHGICSEFMIKHISLIYPVLAEVTEKTLNDKLLILHDDHTKEQQNEYYLYTTSVRMMANELNVPWLIDVPSVFLDKSNDMFLDFGHLNSKGNRAYAEYVYPEIIKMFSDIFCEK